MHEPPIVGRLSSNIQDANGKKLTRCEYRYESLDGDFLSVVAEIKGRTVIEVTEQSKGDEEAKIYPQGQYAAPNAKQIDEFLHKLDTYGTKPGPLTWVGAPLRPDWEKDTSTTWLIMNYEDVQFVVSSRQQLPDLRYDGFNTIYTYLTSYIPNFNRKMHQNIGEPHPEITGYVHGKKVKLVPGTGNTANVGAEVNFEGKLWWVEEEFVGEFETTDKAFSIAEEKYGYDYNLGKAWIKIDEKGNFEMKIEGDEKEYIGSLDETRLYQVPAKAYMLTKTKEYLERLERDGKITYGAGFSIDYDPSDRRYGRLKIEFEGSPYVAGRGAIAPKLYLLDRKK